MKVSLSQTKLNALRSDLLIVAVDKKEISGRSKLRPTPGSISLSQIYKHFDLPLSATVKAEGFDGKPGSVLLVRPTGDKKVPRLLLVGAPEDSADSFDSIEYYRKLGAAIAATASKVKSSKPSLSGNNLQLHKAENYEALLEGMILGQYSYDKYKSGSKRKTGALNSITVLQSKKLPSGSLNKAKALCSGTSTARDLVNMPAGDCNPNYMASFCRSLARKKGLRCQVYDKNRLKKLKAFSIISVAEGSDQPPYIIKLSYKPQRKRSKVISIVGKGVTFDTGGNSIKPSTGMMDMKCDMAGAAAVIGAMEAIAAIKPNHEVRGYVPVAENMVSGNATRPGDIVKAMNGKSIEILNTDAEGRLILADALCLAERDGADTIIDLATLTGACVVALGDDYAAVYSTEDEIAEDLISAGEVSGERLWHMPLAKEYKSQLKSYIADMKNIGGRAGGSITAALFLKNFVEKTPWAHMDIAGPAYRSGGNKGYLKTGGVGFGVRTLVRYVLNYGS